MFAEQYSNQRVFITGHTGFKGSWLTAWLLELGAQVAGFSLDIPTEPAAFTELGLERHITHFTGDVRDRRALALAMDTFRPQVVFHLAAQSLVRLSYEDPARTFETNAMGTLNLLEAVRCIPGIRAVVCITSDKCYRNDEWVWGYRESDHLGGSDPYSASKACAEQICRAYFQSFFQEGPALATARAGNVVGGGDWAKDRIVPDCARAWAKGKAVSIRSPWSTRPWQHVLEPLSGYLWLGAKLLLGENRQNGTLPIDKEAFNFGPESAVNATVAQVCAALARHWPNFQMVTDTEAAATRKESTLLKLCCDKALAHLGWQAVLSFDETIRYTAEWYRAYYAAKDADLSAPQGGSQDASQAPDQGQSGLDMLAFTSRQIADYTAHGMEKGLPWAR